MITDDVQRVLEQIFGADATPDIRPGKEAPRFVTAYPGEET
jgi:hypothetical protein